MDWQEIIKWIVVGLLGGGGGGYLARRQMNQNQMNDAAQSAALKIYEDMVKQQRIEMRERDAEWQHRLDRLKADYTEFRQKTKEEFAHVQKFNRATQNDIRKLNVTKAGDSIPDLDTQIYMTGMGPLDHDG